MKALTYMEHGKFKLIEKPKPELLNPRDAIVRVTLGSICTSDLHIKHGSVPRAVPGITVGHEMVGIVEQIGDEVTDEQALFVGDVLATGFWAARISEITPEDTVLIIGAGPTGICTLLCVMLKKPKRIIVCEKEEARRKFVQKYYEQVLTCTPEECEKYVQEHSDHGGADVVLEVAGAGNTFELAWKCARPNATVTVVALYDEAQTLPLPQMYGKNLTFKTGGVDGCDCAEILELIAEGKIDTTPLITHHFALADIEEAYRIFENRLDGVIKIAITEK